MAYTKNILPKSAVYYSLNRANINGSDLVLEAGGYAEISISHQMLPKLTSKMLVVIHPSVFSDYYKNTAVQVYISVVLTSGEHLEYLVSASETSSGVFNAELDFPEEDFAVFTYKIISPVPVTIYNWELCYEESIDVTTVIDGVEQSIPRLLYDYNTYSYAVGQYELTVGLITCFLLADTDLQGHFTLSFFATERCNVHVRIKDNGITELFSPQVYTVEKGYASISIPHAYLKKRATDHAFSVTIQCTNGQLSIPVRGLLYTIDGGYLATRLLDAGVDVQDISIKQLSTDNSPSEIYAIGYEGDRLILKSREYSLLQRVNWIAIKDFGQGKGAAVEFTGKWLNRNNADRYTIETEETPHVFIINDKGILINYHGSDFSNEEILDTDVDVISACQGFSSMYDIMQNQGLVVVYIKNGNVLYRQRLYNPDIKEYQWYPAITLYNQGDASFVSIHRLPDYRLGICVVHSSGTKWFITNRTYISQAVKPELIQPSLSDSYEVFTVVDKDKADNVNVATINSFEVGSTHFNTFIMTFKGPLIFKKDKTIEDLKQALNVYINGALLKKDKISSININDNSLIIILVDDVKGGSTVRIEYSSFIYLVMRIYNNCYKRIKADYTWKLPVNNIYGTHEESLTFSVEATSLNINMRPIITTKLPCEEITDVNIQPELDCKVRQIITTTLNNTEDIEVVVNNELTLTVSLVGTSPI